MWGAARGPPQSRCGKTNPLKWLESDSRFESPRLGGARRHHAPHVPCVFPILRPPPPTRIRLSLLTLAGVFLALVLLPGSAPAAIIVSDIDASPCTGEFIACIENTGATSVLVHWTQSLAVPVGATSFSESCCGEYYLPASTFIKLKIHKCLSGTQVQDAYIVTVFGTDLSSDIDYVTWAFPPGGSCGGQSCTGSATCEVVSAGSGSCTAP